jgi:hypothetical protein
MCPLDCVLANECLYTQMNDYGLVRGGSKPGFAIIVHVQRDGAHDFLQPRKCCLTVSHAVTTHRLRYNSMNVLIRSTWSDVPSRSAVTSSAIHVPDPHGTRLAF